MRNMCLNDLKIGEKCKILNISNDNSIKRRLLDIGLTKNTLVESVFKNFDEGLTAYMIRGSLIAIRKEDARKIIIEVV